MSNVCTHRETLLDERTYHRTAILLPPIRQSLGSNVTAWRYFSKRKKKTKRKKIATLVYGLLRKSERQIDVKRCGYTKRGIFIRRDWFREVSRLRRPDALVARLIVFSSWSQYSVCRWLLLRCAGPKIRYCRLPVTSLATTEEPTKTKQANFSRRALLLSCNLQYIYCWIVGRSTCTVSPFRFARGQRYALVP